MDSLLNSSDFIEIGEHPCFSGSKVYMSLDRELAITYPLPSTKDLKSFYESGFYVKDDNSDALKRRLKFSKLRADAQIKFIQSSINIDPNLTVIDIGCSDGNLLLRFQELGCQIFGFEPDNRMAQFANRRLGGGQKEIVKNCFFSASSLDCISVQLICSSHLLEHIADQEAHLRELREVLDKGRGMLFLEVPNEYSLGVKNCINPDIFPPATMQGHLYFYSVKSIKALLHDNGFEVLKISTCGRKIDNFFDRFSSNRSSLLERLISKFFRKISSLAQSNLGASRLQSENLEDEQNMNTYWPESYQGQWIRVLAQVAKL